MVFTFPFDLSLYGGDKVEFKDAVIEYKRGFIPVWLIDYSEVVVKLQNADQSKGFREILRCRRRDLDIVKFVKQSWSYDYGSQRTPRLGTIE